MYCCRNVFFSVFLYYKKEAKRKEKQKTKKEIKKLIGLEHIYISKIPIGENRASNCATLCYSIWNRPFDSEMNLNRGNQ